MGAILGTIVTLWALNHVAPNWGWRIACIVGPVLALCIIYVRRNLPESPRWQIMHGRQEAAEASIREIEEQVSATKGPLPPVDESKELEIRPAERIGYLALLRALFRQYPGRSTLVAALMITQSFLYNAIFFTYGLVLEYFFHVKATDTGYYFFASTGASAGYLTASEVFPLEVRAKSIAVFFAIAQCFGAFGSHWYGHLIGTGTDRNSLFIGYLVGAAAMVLGGVAAIFFGVSAEGKSLEDVAKPLSVIGKPSEAIFRTGGDSQPFG